MSAPGNGSPAKGPAGSGPASPTRPSDPAATTSTLPAVEKDAAQNTNGSGVMAPGAWSHLSASGSTSATPARPSSGPDTDEIRAAAAQGAPSPSAGSAPTSAGSAPAAPPFGVPSVGPMGATIGPPVPPTVPPPGGPAGPQTFAGPGVTIPPPMQAPPIQIPHVPPPPGVVPPARRPAAVRAPRRPGDRAPRRAHLQVKHVDVWSVLKLACVLSVSLFFVWLVVVGVIFGLLDVTGVVDKINQTAHTLYNNNNDPVTPGIVLGGALVIGVINIVLFIVLTTIGSVVYNLCADLVGGVEVTLSERG